MRWWVAATIYFARKTTIYDDLFSAKYFYSHISGLPPPPPPPTTPHRIEQPGGGGGGHQKAIVFKSFAYTRLKNFIINPELEYSLKCSILTIQICCFENNFSYILIEK